VAELLGTHSYQLDPKGRVSLPARFREAFADLVSLAVVDDAHLKLARAVFRRGQRKAQDQAGADPTGADVGTRAVAEQQR